MRKAVALSVALCLSAVVGLAQTGPKLELSTGRGFLATCGRIDIDEQGESANQQIGDIECIYYVTGVMDGIHDLKGPQSLQEANICIPPDATMMDLMKGVIRLARSKDEYLDTKTNVLIYMSLLQGYPCR